MISLQKHLPTSPNNKSQWPWFHAEELHPNKVVKDFTYPRISIITPSYNQGHFIEETIRSVLLQGYPNLEYILIDGGSTDNTVEILKKYEPWLSYWVSEPDQGQAHAINKGLQRATGDLIAYLNSDDYYLPGTFLKVANHWQEFPDADLLHGRCRYINSMGEKIGEQFGHITQFEEIIDLWSVWWKKRQFVQPEVFWTRRITEKIGLFHEELHYVMDYDYWCRILRAGGIVTSIDYELTCFRFTSHQKSTHRDEVARELLRTVEPMLWDNHIKIASKKRLELQSKWLYQACFLEEIEKSVHQGEPQLKRWLKLLAVIIQHPKILLSSFFRSRLVKWMKDYWFIF